MMNAVLIKRQIKGWCERKRAVTRLVIASVFYYRVRQGACVQGIEPAGARTPAGLAQFLTDYLREFGSLEAELTRTQAGHAQQAADNGHVFHKHVLLGHHLLSIFNIPVGVKNDRDWY